MADYKVVTTCFHGGSLHKAGSVASFPDGEKVPKHFEPVAEGEAASEEKPAAQAPETTRPPRKRR